MKNATTKRSEIYDSKLCFLFNMSIINHLIIIMSNQNLLYARLRRYFRLTEYSG